MKISQATLQASLREALVQHRVPGASVAILHKGEVTTAAAGVVNVNTQVEVTPDTVMHIASITKVLNATLVMQLVDEGVIDLDDRIVRHLPDLRLKDREALEQITVKMLLNHTSGINGEWLPDFGHDEETIDKAISRFAQLDQLFRPGAEFSYCNAATVVAGYLVQRLRNRSWYQLVRERIFEPLNMQHSVSLPEDALLHRASVGHFLKGPGDNEVVRTSSAFLSLSFGPAGSTLMLSARDLLEFARAHINDGVGANGKRILSAQSARRMRLATVNNKGKAYTLTDGVGVGWLLCEDGLIHHAGGGAGIVSVLYVYPKHQFAAVILTNASHGMHLVNEMMEPWLRDLETMRPFGSVDVAIPREPVNIEANQYVGRFEDVMNCFDVVNAAGGLELSKKPKFACDDGISLEATKPAHLIPLGQDKFYLESGEASNELFNGHRVFAFKNPGSDGRMQHMGNVLRLYKRTC